MKKTPKILSNNKYKYYDLEFPIYKTKNGCRLINIGNTFYNLENKTTVEKVKDEYNKKIRLEICEEDKDYVII